MLYLLQSTVTLSALVPALAASVIGEDRGSGFHLTSPRSWDQVSLALVLLVELWLIRIQVRTVLDLFF